MEEIFEQWEELKNRGEISEAELKEIEELKLKIKENALKKVPVTDLVKTLINKMNDQIQRHIKTTEKLIYGIEESEKEEIDVIENRLMLEFDKEKKQK